MIFSLLWSLSPLDSLLSFLPSVKDWFVRIFISIGWVFLVKMAFFTALILAVTLGLLELRRRFMERMEAGSIRTHILSIRNHGNAASVYFLRVSEVPDDVEIHFFSGGFPLILFQKPVKAAAEEKNTAMQQAAEEKALPPRPAPTSLIPDISHPFPLTEAVGTVQKQLGNSEEKLGILSRLAGLLSVFLPKSIQGKVQAQQDKLAAVQKNLSDAQNAPTVLQQRMGAVSQNLDRLGVKDQASQQMGVLKDQALAGFPSAPQAGGAASGQPSGRIVRQNNIPAQQAAVAQKLSLPESAGRQMAAEAGETFAETPQLQPGRSLLLTIELKKKRPVYQPVTQSYKIEVRQQPLVPLGEKIPVEIINGVAVFPAQKRWSRLRSRLLAGCVCCLSAGVLILMGIWVF